PSLRFQTAPAIVALAGHHGGLSPTVHKTWNFLQAGPVMSARSPRKLERHPVCNFVYFGYGGIPMTPVSELPPFDQDSGRLNVIVDTPKGSRNKYKWDEKDGQWRLSKVLPDGMCFPYDFGIVPSKKTDDNDPVDVLLLMDEPSFPGC